MEATVADRRTGVRREDRLRSDDLPAPPVTHETVGETFSVAAIFFLYDPCFGLELGFLSDVSAESRSNFY
jgi:hypothetical protein